MPSRYGSLYDAYRLENSRTIPLYVGSAAPEALQVGQYMQGLYDQAQSGAFGIDNGLQSITSLPKDKALADNLRTTVQGKLSEMSKRGDYENMLPDVQRLASDFSNRYRELRAPMEQRDAFIKGLDEKEYNLTDDQKRGLIQMSDAGYSGLQRDEYGRLTGKYAGTGYDKNMDINKWVDDRMKDIAIQKGGSEIANDNGEWKIKRGTKWEKLDPGTIENTLRSAMSNDAGYLGYRGMMGRIAGYRSGQIDIDQLPDMVNQQTPDGKIVQVPNPVKKQIQDLAKAQGTSTSAAAQLLGQRTTEQGIESNALNYAKTKYAMNNVTTESSTGIGDFQTARYAQSLKEQASGPGIFGDLVTGQGIDLSQKYGNATELGSKIEATTANVNTAETYMDGQRNRVARAIGIKPSGAGNKYTKADLDKVSDQQVEAWYSQNDPQELGRFQSNRGIISGSREQIAEMNQVRDAAMDAAVKKATGGQRTFNQLKEEATKTFQEAALAGKFDLTSLVDNSTGIGNSMSGSGRKFFSAGINKDNVKDFEIIDGNKSTMFNTQLTVRNKKTGRIMEVHMTDGREGKEFNNAAKSFAGINWKDSYKEGVQGLRSNMTWMPLLNKTSPDGEVSKAGAYAMRAEGLISAAAGAGAIRLADNNDSPFKKDDESNYKSLIAAGQYKLLGIGIDPKTGQRRAMVNIVVDKDASDPADRYKTVMLGADSNFWDRMASSVQQTAGRDLQSSNTATRGAAMKDLQFGLGMQTGSAYSNISSMMAGHSRQIKNASGDTEFKIVASPTGDGSNALMYYLYKTRPDGSMTTEPPVPFNSSLDLGAYIDMQRADGKTLTK
jgi:hypothetical protein